MRRAVLITALAVLLPGLLSGPVLAEPAPGPPILPPEAQAVAPFVTDLRRAYVLSVFPRNGQKLEAALRQWGVTETEAAQIGQLLAGDGELGALRRQDRLVLSLIKPAEGEPELVALQIRGAARRHRVLARGIDGGYGVYAEDSPVGVEIAVASGTAKAGLKSLLPLPQMVFPKPVPAALTLAPSPALPSAPLMLGTPQALSGLIRPIAKARLTSNFGWRMHPVLGDIRFHKGIDFAAPLGTPVYATADGVVEAMEWRGNYGRQVILRHDRGLESRYAHLSGYEMGLTRGTRVAQGQVIGYVGASGMATGPHLDFELRVGGQPVDPAVMMSLW